MNEKLLEMLINILWPKILAAYGDRINEAFTLAINFKTFADELMARFERIENRLTNIEGILQDAQRRNGAGADLASIGFDPRIKSGEIAIGSRYSNSSGGINGQDAGSG